MGDETGIVVIPTEEIDRVLKTATRIKNVEEYMTGLILEGHDYVEARKEAEAKFPE